MLLDSADIAQFGRPELARQIGYMPQDSVLFAGTIRDNIARALIADPPVLLLDEPSSNLDRAAEEQLRDTLALLARDHTVLVVTHSPVLLPATNNIVVLEAGHLAAPGPTADLLPRLSAPPRVTPLRAPQA